jgi:predicted nucleotidyltransferase
MTGRAASLPANDRRLVLAILRGTLPPAARVWVFGSRATGRARRFSDLDLAIDCGRPLSLDESARLAEAFSDSDLPYKVDVVDWHGIGDGFRTAVAGERVPLGDIGLAGPEAK